MNLDRQTDRQTDTHAEFVIEVHHILCLLPTRLCVTLQQLTEQIGDVYESCLWHTLSFLLSKVWQQQTQIAHTVCATSSMDCIITWDLQLSA